MARLSASQHTFAFTLRKSKMWTYKMDVAKGFVFMYDGVVKAVTDNAETALELIKQFHMVKEDEWTK